LKCSECYGKDFLVKLESIGNHDIGLCIATCGVSGFLNNKTGNCEYCDLSCKTCVVPEDPYKCKSCFNGEYLFIIDGEDNIVFGSCNEECPDGFYENKKQNLCQFCDITCKKC